jgi:hypothetical protein
MSGAGGPGHRGVAPGPPSPPLCLSPALAGCLARVTVTRRAPCQVRDGHNALAGPGFVFNEARPVFYFPLWGQDPSQLSRSRRSRSLARWAGSGQSTRSPSDWRLSDKPDSEVSQGPAEATAYYAPSSRLWPLMMLQLSRDYADNSLLKKVVLTLKSKGK